MSRRARDTPTRRELVRRGLEGASGGPVTPKRHLLDDQYRALYDAGVRTIHVGWYLATGRAIGGVDVVLGVPTAVLEDASPESRRVGS